MLRECETFFRSGVETWFGYQQVFLDAPYEAKRAVADLLTWCERCKHRGDHAERSRLFPIGSAARPPMKA